MELLHELFRNYKRFHGYYQMLCFYCSWPQRALTLKKINFFALTNSSESLKHYLFAPWRSVRSLAPYTSQFICTRQLWAVPASRGVLYFANIKFVIFVCIQYHFLHLAHISKGSRILIVVLKIKDILKKFGLIWPWRRGQRFKVTGYTECPSINFQYVCMLSIQTEKETSLNMRIYMTPEEMYISLSIIIIIIIIIALTLKKWSEVKGD